MEPARPGPACPWACGGGGSVPLRAEACSGLCRGLHAATSVGARAAQCCSSPSRTCPCSPRVLLCPMHCACLVPQEEEMSEQEADVALDRPKAAAAEDDDLASEPQQPQRKRHMHECPGQPQPGPPPSHHQQGYQLRSRGAAASQQQPWQQPQPLLLHHHHHQQRRHPQPQPLPLASRSAGQGNGHAAPPRCNDGGGGPHAHTPHGSTAAGGEGAPCLMHFSVLEGVHRLRTSSCGLVFLTGRGVCVCSHAQP